MIRLEEVIQLKEGEEVKALMRRHVVTLLPQLVAASVLIVAPFFFLFPLFTSGPAGIVLFGVLVLVGVLVAVSFLDQECHAGDHARPRGELEHPEPAFFLVGMKSYGRAPTFLLATGYEKVRSITASIAGDLSAASDVELVLPATGVCSSSLPASGSCGVDSDAAERAASSGCCS